MDFFISREERVSIQNLEGSRLTRDDSFPSAPLVRAKTPPYLRGKEELQVHAVCVCSLTFCIFLGSKVYASSCSHKTQATKCEVAKTQATKCEVAKNIELAIGGIE
jgi:hypothetical protein